MVHPEGYHYRSKGAIALAHCPTALTAFQSHHGGMSGLPEEDDRSGY